ncbi:MAG: hypothetical protein HYZ81_19405 [Nitrospinae bacterium]|nr:hypothetical protein [Nitrospinota bacterium]
MRRIAQVSILTVVMGLLPVPVFADAASDQFRKELETLKKQMQEMQHTIKDQQKTISAQQETIEKLEKAAAKPVELPPAQKEELRKEVLQELTREERKVVTPKPVPARGRGLGGMELFTRGIQSLNPDISIDGLFAAAASTEDDFERLFSGAHDPTQRGFTLQNLELTLSGAVDPYFRGDVHLVYQIDRKGESTMEVEEAYLTSLSLPYNLQLKAGQFFTQFGRLNPTHPHTWDFADQPLVNGRMFGGDGLRNPGMQFSYLLPLPFYMEAMTTVQDSQGETAFSFRSTPGEEELFGRPLRERKVRGLDDMLWVPRLRTSFNLSDTQTLLLGTSVAAGPNASGLHTRTNIYGLDLYWRWKPLDNFNGWPFLSFQTEGMFREYQAGRVLDEMSGDLLLPRRTLNDWGMYAQILWGFFPRWVAGMRFDYVEGNGDARDDPHRDRRLRYSPNITFYPSEFSKWRLQYNFDDEPDRGRHDHTVTLQYEFLIGTHGAHTF